MTLTMQTLPASRGYQYCELVFNYGDKGNDILSSSPRWASGLNQFLRDGGAECRSWKMIW